MTIILFKLLILFPFIMVIRSINLVSLLSQDYRMVAENVGFKSDLFFLNLLARFDPM